MFMHFAGCLVWGDEQMIAPCTCPREWRIRKDCEPTTARERKFCWVVSHRDDSAVYHPMIRVVSVQAAIEAVSIIINAADRYRHRPIVSGGHRG